MSVITSHQQDPPTSSLSFAGLTSTSIFQDELGSVTIEYTTSVMCYFRWNSAWKTLKILANNG